MLQHKLQKLISAASCSCRLSLRSLAACNTQPLYAKDQTLNTVDVAVSERTDGTKHAHFIGLRRCKSSWACPVCANQVANEYANKVTKIIEHWREHGYKAFMVTFIIPHYRYQSAALVLDNLYTSLRKFNKNTNAYRKRLGILGTIRACECKYNPFNGWHFHAHVLFFVPEEHAKFFTSEQNQSKLEAHWQTVVKPLRLHPQSNVYTKHSLWISPEEITNGKYLAKELVKTRSSHKTKAKSPTLDVFELLESDNPIENDLFLEFAQAVHGHTRLKIGRNLLKGVDLGDLKKKDAGETDITSTVVVASFSFTSWNELMERELEDDEAHRVNILRAAELLGFSGVFIYCTDHGLPLPHEPTHQFISYEKAL